MRLFRKREPKPDVPKVWVEIHGLPFYVPVTSEFVELHYGLARARRLRAYLLREES